MSGNNSGDYSGNYSGDDNERDDCREWTEDYTCDYYWDTSADERKVYYNFHIGSSTLAALSLSFLLFSSSVLL